MNMSGQPSPAEGAPSPLATAAYPLVLVAPAASHASSCEISSGNNLRLYVPRAAVPCARREVSAC